MKHLETAKAISFKSQLTCHLFRSLSEPFHLMSSPGSIHLGTCHATNQGSPSYYPLLFCTLPLPPLECKLTWAESVLFYHHVPPVPKNIAWNVIDVQFEHIKYILVIYFVIFQGQKVDILYQLA